MPRKGTVPVRDVVADPILQSQLVEKFINCMMWDGKKSTSQSIFYTALDKVGQMSSGEIGRAHV